MHFKQRQGSARNISIKIQLLTSEEKFSALPVIYGKSSCPELLSEAYTSVNYHNRCPNFNEEFKLRLPTKINKQTHLFFTFIHVHTKQKNDTPIEEIVGYTWLPLWRDDFLQTGSFQLPVLAEAPTPGYSFLTPTNTDSMVQVKWIDNHKPLFFIHLESFSSIFSQDPYVDRFFRITFSLDNQAHMASYLHTANFYEEFSRSITGLTNASIDSLVKFFHLILNRLILLIVRPPQMFCNSTKPLSNSVRSFQTLIFETMIMIVSKINNALYQDNVAMRSGILSTFIQFQAVFPQPEIRLNPDNSNRYSSNLLGTTCELSTSVDHINRTFHEELLHQWLISNESIRDKLFENAFFLFDILFKSLCVHLSLNRSFMLTPRKRVSKSFLTNLEELVRLIGDYMYEEIKPKSTTTSSSPVSSFQNHFLPILNQSFAFFIRDLLSILDRNFIFNHMIKSYVRKLGISVSAPNTNFNYTAAETIQNNSKQLSDSLFELRVDFLRVFAGHEHFIALNLPIGTSLFTALEQCINSSHNHQVFTPSSSFAKAMLNSSIFSHSIFDRIRPYAELTDDYRRQHWPLGIIFCTLVDSFTKTKPQLQLRAANLLRSIMTSHDWDQRYKGIFMRMFISIFFAFKFFFICRSSFKITNSVSLLSFNWNHD